MIRGWSEYADAHGQRYKSPIGEDAVLGEHWAQVGAGLRGLLNGELGRLDGATIDGMLCDALLTQDFDPDEL
jgi:hypothetical protein